MKNTVLAAARQLSRAGFTFCPDPTKDKPTVRWKPFQKRVPTADEINSWFANGSALASDYLPVVFPTLN